MLKGVDKTALTNVWEANDANHNTLRCGLVGFEEP